MTLHRMRLFVTIAKHMSITKAARELHISQPSISYQLRLLQEWMGASLFIKAGRGIELTDNGYAFLEQAVAVLSQIDNLNRKHREIGSVEALGPLRIGGSYGPSASLLPSLLTVFSKQNRSVELRLRTGSTSDVQDLLTKSEVDIAVATNPAPSRLLNMEPFRNEKLSIFISSGRLIGKKRIVKAVDISKLPFIIPKGIQGQTPTEELLAALFRQNSKLKVLLRCDSPESVKAAVRQGAGAAILNHELIKEDVRSGTFKVLKLSNVELAGRSYIMYRKDGPLSSSAQSFLALLRARRTNFTSRAYFSERTWVGRKQESATDWMLSYRHDADPIDLACVIRHTNGILLFPINPGPMPFKRRSILFCL